MMSKVLTSVVVVVAALAAFAASGASAQSVTKSSAAFAQRQTVIASPVDETAQPQTVIASPVHETAQPQTVSVSPVHETANRPLTLKRAAGNWTWWGYRTNSWETWAVATQSPSYINLHMGWLGRAMGFYVYSQAWVWRLTAQNARMMGQCLGIDWAGSGLIVGCSSS
jgi:hypothetical protein